ncbi:MAG: nucleoside phosphorylase [Acidimicrobiales bacterium]|nr:nucleoside phosphorylase [Acidimicrobiales bacterium]
MTAVLPITGIPVAGCPERVVVVGDPARAAKVAERLDDSRSMAAKREYHSYRGRWNDIEVMVVSHGVGSAGAGVCFSEIIRGGARRIIRAGTCGGLQPDVADGDLVVAIGAVRDDGYSRGVVPLAYPAVADPGITAALQSHAPGAHRGIVLTSDVFYPSAVLGSNLPQWQAAGCIAVEMECAALFVAASLSGVAAGAVLAVDGNPLADSDESMEDYNPDRQVVADAVSDMIDAGLNALVA